MATMLIVSEINAQVVSLYKYYALLIFFNEKAITENVSIFPG